MKTRLLSVGAALTVAVLLTACSPSAEESQPEAETPPSSSASSTPEPAQTAEEESSEAVEVETNSGTVLALRMVDLQTSAFDDQGEQSLLVNVELSDGMPVAGQELQIAVQAGLEQAGFEPSNVAVVFMSSGQPVDATAAAAELSVTAGSYPDGLLLSRADAASLAG